MGTLGWRMPFPALHASDTHAACNSRQARSQRTYCGTPLAPRARTLTSPPPHSPHNGVGNEARGLAAATLRDPDNFLLRGRRRGSSRMNSPGNIERSGAHSRAAALTTRRCTSSITSDGELVRRAPVRRRQGHHTHSTRGRCGRRRTTRRRRPNHCWSGRLLGPRLTRMASGDLPAVRQGMDTVWQYPAGGRRVGGATHLIQRGFSASPGTHELRENSPLGRAREHIGTSPIVLFRWSVTFGSPTRRRHPASVVAWPGLAISVTILFGRDSGTWHGSASLSGAVGDEVH